MNVARQPVSLITPLLVVRLDGSQPIRYSLKLELDAKYRLLREELARLSGVYCVLLVDVFGGIVRVC